MAAQTEVDVAATELEKVEAALPDLFEVEDTFYSAIEKASDVQVVSFREMRVPLKMWPGGKPGSFDPAGGDLGRGSGPKYDKATISPITTKHAIEWQLKAAWATDDRRKAIINSVRETVAEAMAEYRRFLDSLAMTSGNGVLATISSVAANTPTGYDTYTCTTDYGVRLLRYNHNVTIYQPNLSAPRHSDVTEIEIVNIDYANKTFTTVTKTNRGQANDVVVHSGLSGANPVSFFGVGYHASNASTGTWLGLDRATYPQIRANAVNAAGGLNLSHIRLALNRMGERLGMNRMGGLQAWMHPAQVQAYEEIGQLAQIINRSGGSSQGLDMYFDINQIAGVPIKKHFSWSKSRIDLMDMKTWGRAEVAPVEWLKTEGKRIYNVYGASGGIAASFVSYLVSSFNYFVREPGRLSYVYGLTVPAGY